MKKDKRYRKKKKIEGQESPSWILRNKSYFEIVSTIVLTVTTSYAIWDNHSLQMESKRVTEVQYKPDFRIITGYSDSLYCNNKKDTLFNIAIFNDGHDVEVNYTTVEAFIEIYHRDTIKRIPINDIQCYKTPRSKKGYVAVFGIEDIIGKFESSKEKMFEKIDSQLNTNQLYGSSLKYIMKISYRDFLTDKIEVKYFEITDDSEKTLEPRVGELYYSKRQHQSPISARDINENTLAKLFLK